MIVYLPSFILSVILVAATISVYGAILPLQFLPVILIICLISFIVLRITDKHRLVGTLLIMLFIVGCIATVHMLSTAGRQSTDVFFWQWVLTSGDEVEFNIFYVLALLVGSGMFFSITVYYFGVVLYRISFLTLVSLMPCVLYAKVLADIDNYYLIMIAGASLILHISRVEMKAEYDTRNLKKDKKRVRIPIVAGLQNLLPTLFFIFFVLLICALIPKEEEAKYYDRFEEVFLGGDTTSDLSQDYSSLTEYSGNADNYSGSGSRRMYTLYGDAYAYMKRQNFDYYDFDNDRWYYDKESLDTVYSSDGYRASQGLLQVGLLQSAIRAAGEADPDFLKKYGLERLAAYETLVEPMHSLYIHSENFSASYYLNTSRGIGVIAAGQEEDYDVTRSGVFIRKNGQHAENFSYRLTFYDQTSAIGSWVALGATDFDDETAREMLTELNDILSDIAVSEKDPAKKTEYTSYADCSLAYLDEQEYANEYALAVSENNALISDDIRKLAEDLTKDCTNDYSKVRALTQFFRNGTFTYDLEYIPEDLSPEYFLFESRTGSCSDFATAFTLMARSIGLTVRYTEGFMPDLTSRENNFTISERDGHAYPEVFIPNTGWLIFEPTIGGNAEEDEGGFFLWRFFSRLRIDYGLAAVIILFLAVIVFIVVLIRLIIPMILEGIFKVRMLHMPVSDAVIKSYRRLRRKVRRDDLTPREMRALFERSGVDISLITQSYETLIYADKTIDENAVSSKALRQQYIQAKKIKP